MKTHFRLSYCFYVNYAWPCRNAGEVSSWHDPYASALTLVLVQFKVIQCFVSHVTCGVCKDQKWMVLTCRVVRSTSHSATGPAQSDSALEHPLSIQTMETTSVRLVTPNVVQLAFERIQITRLISVHTRIRLTQYRMSWFCDKPRYLNITHQRPQVRTIKM